MNKTVGVSGIICSGKSTFVKTFTDLLAEKNIPFYHFDADKETHKVIDEHKREIKSIIKLENDEDKPISKAIFDIIFNDAQKRAEYERFIWGKLEEKLLKEREKFFKDKEKSVFLFDAALLFSANWDNYADMIIKIVSDTEDRCLRYIKRKKEGKLTSELLKNEFFLIEKAFEIEKKLDTQRNRKIIFTVNNTINIGDKPMLMEAKVLLETLFGEKK